MHPREGQDEVRHGVLHVGRRGARVVVRLARPPAHVAERVAVRGREPAGVAEVVRPARREPRAEAVERARRPDPVPVSVGAPEVGGRVQAAALAPAEPRPRAEHEDAPQAGRPPAGHVHVAGAPGDARAGAAVGPHADVRVVPAGPHAGDVREGDAGRDRRAVSGASVAHAPTHPTPPPRPPPTPAPALDDPERRRSSILAPSSLAALRASGYGPWALPSLVQVSERTASTTCGLKRGSRETLRFFVVLFTRALPQTVL